MVRSTGRHRGRVAVLSMVFGLGALLVRPALASSPSPEPFPGPAVGGAGDQVVLLGRVVVPQGESVGEVVVFSGRALIAGVARGDVVVLEGPVTVSGQVSGSVIALDGSVRLLATAQVAGDVLAHDDVTIADGASVGGGVRRKVAFTLAGPLRVIGAFVSWLAVAVSTLLLGLLLVMVAPRALDRSALAGRSAPWAALGWGVAGAIALPSLAVAAIAAVVGLPLGLGVLLALMLFALVGAVITVHTVGRAILGDRRRPATAFVTGWGIATVVGLVPYVSGVVFVATSVFGVGEVVVAVWRARRRACGATATGVAPMAARRA